MKLANPACQAKRSCQPFCGMCNNPGKRIITDKSLFGSCRLAGTCICTQFSHTKNCLWINGSKNGGQDCTSKEHPRHHKIYVKSHEIEEAMGVRKKLDFDKRIAVAAQPTFNFKQLRKSDGRNTRGW